MIPSFLELSKKEEDTFLYIINNNLKSLLITPLDEYIDELNKKYFVSIRLQTIPILNIEQKINTIKENCKTTSPIYLEKWIKKNINYKSILANLLQQKNIKSLLSSSNLDIFMQQIITIDTEIPNKFLNLLMNFVIPASERYFSYLLIKNSEFLTNKFEDSKIFIASSVCKDVYSKIELYPNINNKINKNKEKDKKWKLQWY